MICNDEVRLITDITDTDEKINYWKKTAIDLFCKQIGIEALDSHQINFELYKVVNPLYLRTRDFPVNASSIQLYNYPDSHIEIDVHTFRADERDLKKVWVLDSTGKQTSIRYNYVYISYEAGYRTQATIELEANVDLEDKLIIDQLGTKTEYEFVATATENNHILRGSTASATLTNISNKLNGTISDDVLTLPVGLEAEGDMTIVNPNLPTDIKTALSYIIAGGLGDSISSGDIASYRIGSKQVNFRSDVERNYVKSTFDKYVNCYKGAYLI